MILAELRKMRDTPDVIATIKEKYPDHKIYVYPDASGDSMRTTNATISDVSLLQKAGFVVCAPNKNPRVKERVMSVNMLICSGLNKRALLINTRRCPELTECLEQQVYDDNEEPDKSSNQDHMPDALGYFCHYRWPVLKPTATTSSRVDLIGR